MDATTVVDRVVIPEGASNVNVQSLYTVLAGVPDRRQQRGKRYSAALVLTLLLLAKLSGEGKLSGVAQWARLRIDWVQDHLPLERAQLPCGNTYHNVCNQIDLAELNQRLADFFAAPPIEQSAEVKALRVETAVAESAMTETAVTETPVEKSGSAEPAMTAMPQAASPALRHWVLDGKTLRGSHRLAQGKPAQSTLGLYDLETRHVVAQRVLTGKGHERTTALAPVIRRVIMVLPTF